MGFLGAALAAQAQIVVTLLASSTASQATANYAEYPLTVTSGAFDYDFATQPVTVQVRLVAPEGQAFRVTAGPDGLSLRWFVSLAGTLQTTHTEQEIQSASSISDVAVQLLGLSGPLLALPSDGEGIYGSAVLSYQGASLSVAQMLQLAPGATATFTSATFTWTVDGLAAERVVGFVPDTSSTYLALTPLAATSLSGSSFELYTVPAAVPEPSVAALLSGGLGLLVWVARRRRAR